MVGMKKLPEMKPTKGAIFGKPWERRVYYLLKQVRVGNRSKDKHGITYKEIIDIIKEEYGVELTKHQLKNYKNRYVDTDEFYPSRLVIEELKRRHKLIDVATELATNIEIQKERLKRMIKMEEETGIPLNIVHTEMKLLTDMLDRYMKALFDLGYIDKEPEKLQIDTTNPLEILAKIFNEKKRMEEGVRNVREGNDKK